MIYGKRIRLAAVEREDLPTFVKWLNDPEVREGLAMYLPMSLAQEEKWFENMLERTADSQPLKIQAQEGQAWILIGNMGLFDFDHHARSAEIGIMIGEKKYWNQGYGTEAVTLLLQHGFETLNLNRLMLRVYEDNLRAIRCYEKSGLAHDGRLRQARYHRGSYQDVLIMSILKSEWDDRKMMRDVTDADK
jgi:RimJ/RimL family protein N-acetyltransferase